MKVLLKFENGVEDTIEMRDGQPLPRVFIFTPLQQDGEAICVTFYFELADELPSGTVLYKEVTVGHVRRILHEGL